MPPQNHAEPGTGQPPASLSRRSVLRGAAGVGAVSVAAAAGAGTIFRATRSANAATDAHAGTEAGTAAHPAGGEPLVAYLRGPPPRAIHGLPRTPPRPGPRAAP